jgi:hypothetical protein
MKIEIKDLDSQSRYPIGAAAEVIVTNDYGEILFEFLLDKEDSDRILRRQAEYLKKRKAKGQAEEREKAIIEELAKLEHEQWIYWSKGLIPQEPISTTRVNRWKTLWTLPYGLLSEETKEDDRKWARKALKIIRDVEQFYREKDEKTKTNCRKADEIMRQFRDQKRLSHN